MATHLQEEAATIWGKICHNVEQILQECSLYGLKEILIIPDPSVEARIMAMTNFDSVCGVIIMGLQQSHHDYDDNTIRVMINAKQQILHLKLLLKAADAGDEDGFKVAQTALNEQAKHF